MCPGIIITVAATTTTFSTTGLWYHLHLKVVGSKDCSPLYHVL